MHMLTIFCFRYLEQEVYVESLVSEGGELNSMRACVCPPKYFTVLFNNYGKVQRVKNCGYCTTTVQHGNIIFVSYMDYKLPTAWILYRMYS